MGVDDQLRRHVTAADPTTLSSAALDVAFKDQSERSAARNFMEMMARPQVE